MAKRMKIDPYYQRQSCNPSKCTFQRYVDYTLILPGVPVGGLQYNHNM